MFAKPFLNQLLFGSGLFAETNPLLNRILFGSDIGSNEKYQKRFLTLEEANIQSTGPGGGLPAEGPGGLPASPSATAAVGPGPSTVAPRGKPNQNSKPNSKPQKTIQSPDRLYKAPKIMEKQ